MSGYFDHNATAPLLPEAREAWLRASTDFWHNASGLYREAGATKVALEDARGAIAAHLGAEPEQLVFTSGATEANNALIAQCGRGGGVILYSDVEHPSVAEAARRHFGDNVKTAPAAGMEGAIRTGPEKPALVSAMAANNETGAFLPWREISAACREVGVPYHCDAAQWVGRMGARDFAAGGAYVTGCAHKFGGPKGVGFLLVPEGGSFVGQLGGPQEGRRRAGTEDVAGVLAMAAALDTCVSQMPSDGAGRDRFEGELVARIGGVRILGGGGERLWNTSMFLLPEGVGNLKFIARLSAAGFAASTGSACSAGRNNPSAVLAAEGIAPGDQGRAVRVSSGWGTEESSWDALLEAMVGVVESIGEGGRRAGGLDLGGI